MRWILVYSMNNFSLNIYELKALLDNKADIVIVDIREPDEYVLGKINNALLIPILDIRSCLSQISKLKSVIVYCHTGTRSIEIVFHLQWLGLVQVKDLEGGIDAWSRNIDTNIPTYERNPQKTIQLINQFKKQRTTDYEMRLLDKKTKSIVS